ncbi:uncharacterized protein LOC62_05G007786 [Vanrija pseudolonga]|uniref:Uncharacterized protein n=1 Tax=Vanrija pseudolonga TaxID=143232 RepID=A0AAF1BK55_9TREE|nr:hypothetical protein LOC62_05G007786 [Vanrija pseudolonga]
MPKETTPRSTARGRTPAVRSPAGGVAASASAATNASSNASHQRNQSPNTNHNHASRQVDEAAAAERAMHEKLCAACNIAMKLVDENWNIRQHTRDDLRALARSLGFPIEEAKGPLLSSEEFDKSKAQLATLDEEPIDTSRPAVAVLESFAAACDSIFDAAQDAKTRHDGGVKSLIDNFNARQDNDRETDTVIGSSAVKNIQLAPKPQNSGFDGRLRLEFVGHKVRKVPIDVDRQWGEDEDEDDDIAEGLATLPRFDLVRSYNGPYAYLRAPSPDTTPQ